MNKTENVLDMSLEYHRKWIEDRPPPILYHYTSAAGLLGIIENRQVWLSDSSYLNDRSELKHADQLLSNIIAGIGRDVDSDAKTGACISKIQDWISNNRFVCPFVMSLSEEGDLLSQWRAYCPQSGGFSIGFRSNFNKWIDAPFSHVLRPCVYDGDYQRKILAYYVRLEIPIGTSEPSFTGFEIFYRVVRPVLKHPSFEEEKEWRLLSMDDQSLFEGIQFRASGNLIVPYFPAKFSGSKLPIEEVIVGPCTDMALSVASIRRFLDGNGLSTVRVRASESTLRTY